MSIRIRIILKQLLIEHELSAAKLARECKIAPQTINNWLSGQEPRGFAQVEKVADYFGVTVDYLVFGKKENKKDQFEEYADEINAGTFEVVLRRIKK